MARSPSLPVALALLSALPAPAEFLTNPYLGTDVEYSRDVLSWQRVVTNKTERIFAAYAGEELDVGKLYLSGHLSGTYYAEETDTDGKFPLLGRFPGQHTKGDRGSEAVIDNADLAVTYAPVSLVQFFVHGVYTELEFPGQDQYQMREAFATIGNPEVFPLYASFGRKTVNFGNYQSYNPTVHTVNNHFFRTDSDDPVLELGYVDHGLVAAITIIPGGRHLRVADARDSNFFSNFAASLTWSPDWTPAGGSVKLGAGYLYSTIYDSDAANHPGMNPDPLTEWHRNGAVNTWAEFRKGGFSAMAEYTRTERQWPATGAHVHAIGLQAAQDFVLWGNPTRGAVSYGRGIQGDDGTEFSTLDQLAAGVEMWLCPWFAVNVEYVYNQSFVPLIMISRASIDDVNTHSLLVGGKAFF
ncbi:MAG: hypothetical protein HKN82_16925 [Akkermansiaceae bacterium]|nr:hypothetical protein [Akkermansiaceae bacterium]NNM31068.1 hypothetical protein [Akkermansiaceae bacterium]